jgi:hypothetical protein
MLLTREDLNLKENSIPITYRECLLPVMGPVNVKLVALPASGA